MPTSIYGGAGVTVEVKFPTGTHTAYTAIPNLEKIDGPKSKRNIINTPVLGAASLHKLPGELDNGQITVNFWLDLTDTVHVDLYDAWVNAEYFYFKTTGENAKTAEYYVLASSWEESGFENDGAVACQMALDISGDRTNA